MQTYYKVDYDLVRLVRDALICARHESVLASNRDESDIGGKSPSLSQMRIARIDRALEKLSVSNLESFVVQPRCNDKM